MDLGESNDLVIRDIKLEDKNEIDIAIIYIEGLTDTVSIQNHIIEPLLLEKKIVKVISSGENILSAIKNNFLSVSNLSEIENFDELYDALLSGNTILLINKFKQGLIAGTSGGEKRGVQESTSQAVIRGPKDGFTENIRVNTALIRKRIKSPNLWLENLTIGIETQTNVSIMYINGIVNNSLVKEVKTRLKKIQIDGILESGQIEELIQDKTYTPFPTIYNTERPDVIAAGLLEGRIAVLIYGTPFILLVPALFVQFLQSPEDYYQRTDFGLIRILRYMSLFIALVAPSFLLLSQVFIKK